MADCVEKKVSLKMCDQSQTAQVGDLTTLKRKCAC